MKRIRKVVVHITEKSVPSIEQYFTKVIVDGITYYDSKKDMTHQEALDLAKKHGLRVMESWEMNQRFMESKEFRKSLTSTWYWCAAFCSDNSNVAWLFGGDYGSAIYLGYRDDYNVVRCVGLP